MKALNKTVIIKWNPECVFAGKKFETFRNIKTPEAALKILAKRNRKNIALVTYEGIAI